MVLHGTKVGNDLHGLGTDDRFGYNVSISATGSKIIVGAYWDDDGGTTSGTAKIYELVGSTWTQIGNTIVGDGSYYEAGYAVSMSADGSRVAVGMRRFSSYKGLVKVYDLVGSTWTQVGANIIGEASNDYFGSSIVMNDAGTRLLIGAYGNDGGGNSSGHARIYDLVGTTWTQLGDDIDGEEASDGLGFGLGMSASGHRIALGSYLGDNSSNVNTGDVKVFSVNNICTTPLSVTISQSEDGTFSYTGTGSGTSQTIYSENFDGQNGKGWSYNTSNFSGVDWTMDVSAAFLTASTDYFKIVSNRLEAQDTDGPVFWFSPQQNILGYQNVSLSVNLYEAGYLENSDYVKVSVSINGGAYQNINDLGGTNGYKFDDFGSTTATVSGLSGSTIQIRIEMKNNGGGEYLRADNISLTGTLFSFVSLEQIQPQQ